MFASSRPARALIPILALLILAPAAAVAGALKNAVEVFPFPQPIRYDHHNDDFTVRVRTPGGVWQDLYEYNVKVDLDKPQDASFVYFDFDGTVEVSVQKNNEDVRSVRVRPDSKGIRARLENGTAYFTLTKPENLSVEFDGDHLHNLHLFSHAIRKDMPAHPAMTSYEIGAAPNPDLKGPVVTFGPGVYTPPDGPGGSYRIGSNTTVYVDGSALIRGTFVIENAENVRIVSDGLFEGQKDLLWVRNSRHVEIDGPIVFNPVHGSMRCAQSQDVTFRNIRIIGGGQWSDGIGNFACQNVTIADSFIRTSDDSVTVYNHRWDIYGDTRDITLRDSTLWADIAHAVFIGLHGNTPSAGHPDPEVIERVRVSNVDILDEDEDEPEYEGALGITAGDDNLVRDVTFENIRVERIEEGRLFNFHVGFNAKYNTSPGRGIENVTLRNVSYSGLGAAGPSTIFGYDAGRGVRHVVLDNVRVGGRRIGPQDKDLLQVGDFASDVVFADLSEKSQ
jgi:hypothetical protein